MRGLSPIRSKTENGEDEEIVKLLRMDGLMLKAAKKLSTVCTLVASLTTPTAAQVCPIMAFFGALLFKTSPCKASIPPHLLTNDDYDTYAKPRQIVLFFPSSQNMGRGMDARNIEVVSPAGDYTSADIARVIPAQKLQGMQTTQTNPNAPVMTTILGYSVGNYLQSPTIKQSSVGKTATSVQDSMKTETTFGGSKPGGIKHSFAVNVDPFQTKAEMKYKGYTNASLTYTATDSKLNFEIYRDLNVRTKLVFNHTNARSESREVVSLRWMWF